MQYGRQARKRFRDVDESISNRRSTLDRENSDDRITLITQTRNRQHLIEESLTKRRTRMRREKTYPMSSGRY